MTLYWRVTVAGIAQRRGITSRDRSPNKLKEEKIGKGQIMTNTRTSIGEETTLLKVREMKIEAGTENTEKKIGDRTNKANNMYQEERHSQQKTDSSRGVLSKEVKNKGAKEIEEKMRLGQTLESKGIAGR